MIAIDMPLPKRCMDCPLSYHIMSGRLKGMVLCEALEYRDAKLFLPKDNFLVDRLGNNRPNNCPIKYAMED